MPPSTPDDLTAAEPELDVTAHVEIALGRLFTAIPDGATRYQVADRLRDRLPWVKAVSAAQVAETDPRGMSGAAETLGVSRQYLDRLLREQDQPTPRKAAQMEERPLGYRYGTLLELYGHIANRSEALGVRARDEYLKLEGQAIASTHVLAALGRSADRWMRRWPADQRDKMREELDAARAACGELPEYLSLEEQSQAILGISSARVHRRRAGQSPKEPTVNAESPLEEIVAEWAASHKIPLDPHEPVTVGPWAELDKKEQALYLGEWTTERCPLCGQTDRPHVPLIPPPGHAGWSRQHGCGQWWAPAEVKVTEPTREALDAALEELRSEERRARERVRQELRADLARVLSQPEDEREATGSETEPGIYKDDGRWIAWDHDPISEGETITVYADEIGH